MGDTGFEHPRNPREITTLSENGAQSGAPTVKSSLTNAGNDPNLAMVVAAWPKLSPQEQKDFAAKAEAIVKAARVEGSR